MQRLVIVPAGLLLVASCIDAPERPPTPQMCQQLVDECGDPRLSGYLPGYCAWFGRAGLDDPRNEDQCFAVYGDCIDECVYFGYLLDIGFIGADASVPAPDGGGTGEFGSGAVDSGAVDSGAVDSGAVDSGAVDSGAVDSGAGTDGS